MPTTWVTPAWKPKDYGESGRTKVRGIRGSRAPRDLVDPGRGGTLTREEYYAERARLDKRARV